MTTIRQKLQQQPQKLQRHGMEACVSLSSCLIAEGSWKREMFLGHLLKCGWAQRTLFSDGVKA